MPSPESVLIRKILARHGARPDLRLWRNETAGVWAGKVEGRHPDGGIVLRGGRHFQAGLCPGSSDLVGIGPDGRFIAVEVKTGGQSTDDRQRRWLQLIKDLGGIVGVVRSVEDVDDLLGPPPGEG